MGNREWGIGTITMGTALIAEAVPIPDSRFPIPRAYGTSIPTVAVSRTGVPSQRTAGRKR